MSKGDRYLVVTELYLPTKGGTAVWFDQVYRRIGTKGIHVVTADVPGAEEHDSNHPNSVHRVPLRRHWWLRPESLGMYLRLLGKCLSLAARHRFDSVHAGRVLPEGLVCWVISRLLRKPLVVYAHGEEITTWRQPAKFRAMVFTYRHAHTVIANSEFTRRELEKIGVPPDRIAVIHPGVDIQKFRPGLPTDDLRESLGLTRGARLILSVGRLSRRKGFDQVIRVLPALVGAGLDVHYAIVGIGPDADYLRTLAEESGVTDRVHLLGHVSGDDLPRWYNAADVFAMPNREIGGDTEGFGMVFIESAACGKPSIAGIAGGTGAAVLDGVTGLRVDGTSQPDLAAAFKRVLGDAALARGLGQNGYERVRNELSWEAVAQKTLARI